MLDKTLVYGSMMAPTSMVQERIDSMYVGFQPQSDELLAAFAYKLTEVPQGTNLPQDEKRLAEGLLAATTKVEDIGLICVILFPYMVEKVGSRRRTGDGQWQSQNDLFGGSHFQLTAPVQETVALKFPTFTEEDLFYAGTLMVSNEGMKVLKELRTPLDPGTGEEIENYLALLAEKFRSNGVSLEKYFEGDANRRNDPLKILEGRITVFERMTLQQRQAFLQTNAGVALVLGPLATLDETGPGFWLRIAHNDRFGIGHSRSRENLVFPNGT